MKACPVPSLEKRLSEGPVGAKGQGQTVALKGATGLGLLWRLSRSLCSAFLCLSDFVHVGLMGSSF